MAFGLMGTYNSVIPFYISGVALGIGSTFLIYGSIPLIMNNWFKAKAGTSLGFSMAFMGVVGAIFAQVTGILIESIGWRQTYMALGVIVALLILPFTIFVIRSKPEQLNMKAYGEDEVDVENTKVDKTPATGVEKRTALKSPAFYLVLLFTGLFGLASTVSFHVPNFVESIGFTAAMAATGVTCVTIGQTGGKFMLGAINDKFGVKSALFVGIGGGMIGVVALMMSDSFGIGMLYLGALLFGIGFSGSTLLPPVVIRGSIWRTGLCVNLYDDYVGINTGCRSRNDIVQLFIRCERFILYSVYYRNYTLCCDDFIKSVLAELETKIKLLIFRLIISFRRYCELFLFIKLLY